MKAYNFQIHHFIEGMPWTSQSIFQHWFFLNDKKKKNVKQENQTHFPEWCLIYFSCLVYIFTIDLLREVLVVVCLTLSFFSFLFDDELSWHFKGISGSLSDTCCYWLCLLENRLPNHLELTLCQLTLCHCSWKGHFWRKYNFLIDV